MEEDNINLKDIEKERIIDAKNNEYIPERFNKCFIPQNDIAKEVKSIALKLILFRKKYRERSVKLENNRELYLISKIWYRQFKAYSRMDTMKRIIKVYHIYEKRPILFTPDPKNFPGKILFENLFIRNQIGKDNRNILISKYNDSFDTKLNYKNHFKLLTKEAFKLLYNYFQCEYNYVIKVNRKEIYLLHDYYKYYIDFSIHLNIVFIPTINYFQKINPNEIEKFIKEHKIIYDVYFKQKDDKKDIIAELINIFKEKPYILSNMGVKLNLEDKDEITKKINNFVFYKKNCNKSVNEILDDIFNEESIKNIKHGHTIKIPLILLNNFFSLYNVFNLEYKDIKDNIDYVENGVLFLEYKSE